jgi:hypothetical protein
MLVHVQGEASQFDILIPDISDSKNSPSHCLALGEYEDEDGYIVNIGLHVRASALDLFERYKVGPDLINREPKIDDVRVWACS